MSERREIKFRAWDTLHKAMRGHTDPQTIQAVTFHNDYNGRVKVMQYTGLKDETGKEIYESDLLKDGLGYVGEVVFCDGGFWLVHPNGERHMPAENFREVVGNVYEN